MDGDPGLPLEFGEGLEIVDTESLLLGEGEGGGTGPGLQIGDPGLPLEVGEGLESVDTGEGDDVDEATPLQIVAAGRSLPGLVSTDTSIVSSWW